MAKKPTRATVIGTVALHPRKIKRYGWRPDHPDHRDRFFLPRIARLPPAVDLRPNMAFMPCYDQGDLGSCTANAIAAIVQYQRHAEQQTDWPPSRLFIYFAERVIEHSVNDDSGAEIRDGMKAVNKIGVPSETLWPYDQSKFTQKPSAAAYTAALQDRVDGYQRVVQSMVAIKGALSQGHPVAFGFSVFDSFESDEVAKTGVVPMPKINEEMAGGHAVVAVGYDDATKVVICRNSWGSDWGANGYFFMPYAYIANPQLSTDFWLVSHVL